MWCPFKSIRKRDGRVVRFEPSKIMNAIARAGAATGEFDHHTAERLCKKVIVTACERYDAALPTVEQIQDTVEDVLLASTYKRTAKAYILYRDQHARIREIVSSSKADLVERYLSREDWQVKENSNMSYSLQGLNHYLSSEVSKVYWLHKIYPPPIARAHEEGDFHIHDLNQLSVYCVGWDLMDLLEQGFRGVSGKIESRPAKHLRSALGQIVNFFYTLQGEAAGAQAFSNFDTLLAPFIRYDNLRFEEVKQALQEFVFNINVPTRVGFQTPFTNVTMDLRVPPSLKDRPVLIGGEPQTKTYGDFQHEMNLFNRAFLEVMEAGDAKGRVFTFPIPTYNMTKDFDWDAPELEALWRVTAKYGIPYFSNFVNSGMSPDDVRSMCCRLRLDTSKLEHRGGSLFAAKPLTGSVGVVTVNLPRIGYEALDEKGFLTELGLQMDLAKDSLEIKRKVLEKLTDQNLYPYSSYYLRHVKERFGTYWANHFSTIGIIGMNEAMQNLLGVSIVQDEGYDFSLRVLDFMNEKLIRYQQETGHLYNLEATPAESTSYRLARLDKKRYPDMQCADEKVFQGGGKPYYTNSSQLPVNFTENLFEAMDLQDDLQTRYTGGTVFHAFLGEHLPDAGAVKSLIRKMMHHYKMPYVTLTPTFSVCPRHGYLAGEHPLCPKCASGLEHLAMTGERDDIVTERDAGIRQPCEVYSRVVGYLRPVAQWNEGKQEEFAARKEYVLADNREVSHDQHRRISEAQSR